MADEGVVYEVRYGLTASNVALILLSVVFAAAAVVLPELPLVVRVAGVVLFGAGTLIFLVGIVRRQAALRVDARGLTVGGSPVRYRATTLFVPWDELAVVVVWRQRLPHGVSMRHIAVARRPGSPPLPDQRMGVVGHVTLNRLAPNMPADVAATSRPVAGWKLDVDRLRATIQANAPHVQVMVND